MEKLLKYELIELLKKDVLVFNDYREKNNFERIDLSYANLSNANLYNADLSDANLSYANLSYANLSNANLSYSDLSNANLYNADLSKADLYNANLSNANLYNAALYNANLYNADLSYANLSDADLDYASLSFSCKSIKAKFDEKHIIQILYHAAMPTQNNKLNIKDKDLKKLLKLTTFKKVVNKFHRIKETGKFIDFKEQ